MAMQVHRSDEPDIEYAVQPCDEHGKPLSTHFDFFSEAHFNEQYESYRVRPKAKTPTKSKPKKRNAQVKIDSVNLSEVEDNAYA
jgi:hypothetical protein